MNNITGIVLCLVGLAICFFLIWWYVRDREKKELEDALRTENV